MEIEKGIPTFEQQEKQIFDIVDDCQERLGKRNKSNRSRADIALLHLPDRVNNVLLQSLKIGDCILCADGIRALLKILRYANINLKPTTTYDSKKGAHSCL